MKVFICWSGDRSRQIAQAFHWWLPQVIQAIDPWMSQSDLDKGKRWSDEIAKQLADANFGLVCLTPENLASPWIHFESGALSKLPSSCLLTFLYNLEHPQLESPLADFQYTRFEKDDLKRLVRTINSVPVLEKKLSDIQLDQAYEMWWPKLEQWLKEIPSSPSTPPAPRQTDDMVEEILERVRRLPAQISAVAFASVSPSLPYPAAVAVPSVPLADYLATPPLSFPPPPMVPPEPPKREEK